MVYTEKYVMCVYVLHPIVVQHTERHHTQHYPYHNSISSSISITSSISIINIISIISIILPCLICMRTTIISCCMALIKTCYCLQSTLLPYLTPGYQSIGSINLVLPRHAHHTRIVMRTPMVQILEIEEMNADDKIRNPLV